MNPKAALALAIVAILLAGLAYWLVGRVPSSEEQRRRELELFDYSVQKIDRITGKRGKDIAYDLERSADRWVYRAPALGDADAGRVLRALSDLRFEGRERAEVDAAPGAAALERYGLARPRLEVTLHEPGRTIAFEIGADTATKDGCYVRLLPGGRIVVADPSVATLFDVPAEAFRGAGEAAPGARSGR